MSLAAGDQRDLLLPLAEGLASDAPFAVFLQRLAARTGAAGAWLVRAGDALPPPLADLAEAGLLPLALLRPERVYALDEWRFGAAPESQAALPATLDVVDLRAVRCGRGERRGAWLVVASARQPFVAADAALLSGLAPHVDAALRTVDALGHARRMAMLAETALERFGVGQMLLAQDATVLAADPAARRIFRLGDDPGRLPVSPESARRLAAICAEIGPGDAPHLLPLEGGPVPALLLRPADPRTGAAAIAAFRADAGLDPAAAAPVLRGLYGLSLSEAALAVALARGADLVAAGHALRLTTETARNYSKRIYARTGTHGQADLVRLVLTGLAPLA